MTRTQVFKVAPARRMGMVLNGAVYAGAATWWGYAFWHGSSLIDAALALVFAALFLWVVFVFTRRRAVVALGEQGVTVFGMRGQATEIPYAQMTAHTLLPARRTDIVFWKAPDQPLEQFTVITQRAMGATATAAFRASLLARLPDLPARAPYARARTFMKGPRHDL